MLTSWNQRLTVQLLPQRLRINGCAALEDCVSTFFDPSPPKIVVDPYIHDTILHIFRQAKFADPRPVDETARTWTMSKVFDSRQ